MKCRRCKKDKDKTQFYKSKRNKSGHEYICKPCKSIVINAKRYGISEGFIEYLYSHEQCMCCGVDFNGKRDRHIHHTDNGVQGLVCLRCNHILGQETEKEIQQIEAALTYMKSQRENPLDRDYQPGRLQIPGKVSMLVEEPSETTRRDSKKCSQCGRILTKDSFSTDHSTRNKCFDCRRSNVRLSQSRTAKKARDKATNCGSCGCDLNLEQKKCVHHVGDKVLGVVCNRCNQLLGDESKQQKDRLLTCKLWIESQLEHDIVRAAWRHAEQDRNDLASEVVAL